MKIGIGALATSDKPGARQSGVHRYSVQLVRALPEAIGDGQLVVYSGMRWPGQPVPRIETRNPVISVEHPAARVAWERLVLPLHCRNDKLDLYHGLAFALPRGIKAPCVVTIHDLAFLQWPEQVPARRSRYLSRAVREAVRRAERVIAVSHHAKLDVMELLGVPEDRIDVTPLGVDPGMRRADVDAVMQFRREKGLSHPFILAVGNLEPRKNLGTLVRAFDAIAAEIPHELVLVGGEGWKTGELHEALAGSESASRVRLEGFVEPGELPLWYSACEMFVIPSLYEGFGLSLLEAMACGAPAIAANRAALPEVAGDAALLVEPEPEMLSEAMKKLANDTELRTRLGIAGPKRAAGFTWQRTAELTVESYRKVLA